jgi:hypothetical protein
VIRPVLAGEAIRVACEGGFVRRPAPADGVEIDVADTVLFLTVEELSEAIDGVHGRRVFSPKKKAKR